MVWSHLLAYFFGGVFCANCIPHLVAGLQGRPFQTPFARPRGVGQSSSTLNVVWGFFNLAIGYLLVCQIGEFDPRSAADIVPFGFGFLLIALFLGWHFGRFNGGTRR